MSKSEAKDRGAGKSKGQLAMRRIHIHLITLVLVFAAIAMGVFFLHHGRLAAGPETKTAFESLKGRWLRPDGGYVIEIREIEANGKMAAGYFNPRPINVSRAEASQEGTTTKVCIELRDINYPGSTYNLTYDPENDQLKGVYFQAALQQSFDVVFVRLK
jgi:hypothetical protein